MTLPNSHDGNPATGGWPGLPYDEWKDSYATLHMWTQIVGKIRLALTPWINHSWHATLYVTARGLTTSPIPYGPRTFQIDFDFIDHRLLIQTGDGEKRSMPLAPRSVADFHRELFATLAGLNIHVKIHGSPNEVADPIPFAEDEEHSSYDATHVERFRVALARADRVFKVFRARYLGKCSPVHFFWGSFDLAVTRFSGRPAPEHPGGVPHLPDWVTREAYSHEVSSCGFWPGNDQLPEPVFYAYAYPEPEGFSSSVGRPAAAFYHPDFREFILPYEAVRTSATPDGTLLEFLQSGYEAAALHGNWNRNELELGELPGRVG